MKMYEEMYLRELFEELLAEINRAVSKNGPMNSRHEGYAVMLEEFDELWDEIKLKNPNPENLREEAIQIAAMAVRFIHDIVDERSS